MPPKKEGAIWQAKPHTIAKIEILREYMKKYFPILGQSRSGKILYIDAFAGPGEYTNYASGSPLVALQAGLSSMDIPNWSAKEIHFAFIEKDDSVLRHLQSVTAPYLEQPHINLHFYHGEFKDRIQDVMRDVPEPFHSNDPLFTFIDPFGVKGVPFSLVERLLKHPTSEVLINLDVDGISRVFHHVTQSNRGQQLTELFGSNDWERLHYVHDFQEKCDLVDTIYKEHLRAIGTRYVFSFDMKSPNGVTNYYLVFASNHFRGLQVMKEAMSKVENAGAYTFRDPQKPKPEKSPLVRAPKKQQKQQTPDLFAEPAEPMDESQVVDTGQADANLDDLASYAEVMLRKFSGQTVTYEVLLDHVLNYTRYWRLGKMLELLGESNLATPINKMDNRKKYTEDNISAVVFADV